MVVQGVLVLSLWINRNRSHRVLVDDAADKSADCEKALLRSLSMGTLSGLPIGGSAVCTWIVLDNTTSDDGLLASAADGACAI